jgi:DNA-directed RNA polymerase specialized sigma24 family protein
LDDSGTTLLDETDIARELIQTEDAAAVLESLKTLRDIERVVVTQRYYGGFSFAQIAEENGLKLNTVLSHHRRALGKLRPQLTNTLGIGNRHKTIEWEEINQDSLGTVDTRLCDNSTYDNLSS